MRKFLNFCVAHFPAKQDIKTKFPRYKDEIPDVLFQTWMSVPIWFPEQISEAHGGFYFIFHPHTSLGCRCAL